MRTKIDLGFRFRHFAAATLVFVAWEYYGRSAQFWWAVGIAVLYLFALNVLDASKRRHRDVDERIAMRQAVGRNTQRRGDYE